MIEDCPILSMNVKIWLFWAFIRHHNVKRYIIMIPSLCLNLLQWMFLYTSLNKIDILILNAYFTVLYFNGCSRTVVTIIRGSYFERYMESIERTFNLIMRSGDEEEIKILEEHTKHSRQLSISNLVLAGIANMCFVSYPLFAQGRSLPYGVYIPGVNVYESPVYEITFATQIIITFIACFIYIPYSNIFASFIIFGIARVKILQHKLSFKKENTTEGEIENIIKNCVEMHNDIIDFVGEMNKLVTYVSLLEFLSFGLMLCALLFLLAIVNNFAQTVIVCSYIFLIIAQVFTFYFHANKLLEESFKVAEAAYFSPWYNCSLKVKKNILMIIVRAQQPLQVMIGNVYPMTLEMFQSILNTSYSYYTLLKRFYE